MKQSPDITYKCHPCPEMLFHCFLNSYNCPNPAFLPGHFNLLQTDQLKPLAGMRFQSQAARWGGDKLSLSITPRLCREVECSLRSVASSSLWISALQGDCRDPGSPPLLPKEVSEILRTGKFCGTDWTNICWEVLRFPWSSVDVRAHRRPIVI